MYGLGGAGTSDPMAHLCSTRDRVGGRWSSRARARSRRSRLRTRREERRPLVRRKPARGAPGTPWRCPRPSARRAPRAEDVSFVRVTPGTRFRAGAVPATVLLRPHSSSRNVGKQAIDELPRMREGNEVAAWDFVHGLAEPFARDARLKGGREEPIVFTGHDVNRDLRASLGTSPAHRRQFGLVPLVRVRLLGDASLARRGGSRCRGRTRAVYPPSFAAASRASSHPVWSHHSPAVSPGSGSIAFTKTSLRIDVGARAHTSAAVNAPIDCATSVTSFRVPIEAMTRSAYACRGLREGRPRGDRWRARGGRPSGVAAARDASTTRRRQRRGSR